MNRNGDTLVSNSSKQRDQQPDRGSSPIAQIYGTESNIPTRTNPAKRFRKKKRARDGASTDKVQLSARMMTSLDDQDEQLSRSHKKLNSQSVHKILTNQFKQSSMVNASPIRTSRRMHGE